MGSAASDLGGGSDWIKHCSTSVGNLLTNLLPTFRRRPIKPVNLAGAAVVQRKPPEVLIKEAQQELGVNVSDSFNIAVVGGSGVGKSSFINGVRLVRSSSAGASVAAAGVVECTDDIRSFSHPLFPHIVFWDIPGAGTQAHPASTYFNDKKLYAFDSILILTADRFLELDFQLAASAFFYKRPCAFVRTKADISIHSIAEREGITMREASEVLRRNVEASFEKERRKRGFIEEQRPPLFILCNDAFVKDKAYYRWQVERGVDKSLSMMDEHKIYDFIASSMSGRQEARLQKSAEEAQ